MPSPGASRKQEGSGAAPGKPVAERLRVKRERTLAVVDAPVDVDGAIGAQDTRAEVPGADVVVVFVRSRAEFYAAMAQVLPQIGAEAIAWVAYPKLTSALTGDLSRDVVHRLAPAYGLTTVSQIAVDADWSAMRLKRSR